MKKGKVWLIGAPIGNDEDWSFRAKEIAANCEIILCEDTRKTDQLITQYGIRTSTIAYGGARYEKSYKQAFDLLYKNKDIGFMVDRGMPCISDPGNEVIKRCLEEKIEIKCIPGVSSVTTAIALSGFTSKFFFYGFLPRTKAKIKEEIEPLKNLKASLVFFEAANRLQNSIVCLEEILGNRNIIIAKELTKLYENIYRGSLSNIEIPTKGECTIVVDFK